MMTDREMRDEDVRYANEQAEIGYRLMDEHDAGGHTAIIRGCLVCDYESTTTPEERAYNDAEFQRGWDEAKEAAYASIATVP